MAANTKYTVAPQDDPDAAQSYTQAPPSYQVESSSADDNERLIGGPRSSEDNIPDDFKVRTLLQLDYWEGGRALLTRSPAVWRFRR